MTNKLKKNDFDWNLKVKAVMEERDEHIASTKNQIDEFLSIIEQYEEEAKEEN